MVTIKSGSIDDFFASALQTAKEMDNHTAITPKHTIWMESDDLARILKAPRVRLIRYLKNKDKVYYSDLLKQTQKSPASLNRDLELLSRYQLIRIDKEPNSGHGIRKVIQPLFPDEPIVFQAAI